MLQETQVWVGKDNGGWSFLSKETSHPTTKIHLPIIYFHGKELIIIIMFNISIVQISMWIWSNVLYNSKGNQINIAQITILQ